VSTPVADVVGAYSGAVRIAGTAPDFVHEIEAALSETEDERTSRVERERRILARNAWDAIAARMDQIMDEARKGD